MLMSGAAPPATVMSRTSWALAWRETTSAPYGRAACVAAVAALVCWATGWLIWRMVIRVVDCRPPEVAIHDVDNATGISAERLANLGSESFPEMLAFGHTAGLWVRGLLVAVGIGVVIAAFGVESEWVHDTGLLAAVSATASGAPAMPPHWAAFCCLSAMLATAALLLNNRRYQFARFPLTVVLAGVLASAAWIPAASLKLSARDLTLFAGGLSLAWTLRWAADLLRAARFARRRSVSLPIAERIADVVPGLSRMRERRDCALVSLDLDELTNRITAGCHNVEEASLFVARNLARFLDLVRVESEHVVAAMLRYLTVRRFVVTSGATGTPRSLQCPLVPIWNEQLFPLHPPCGFVDWIDPLLLGPAWDIVSTCSPCSGSGRVACFQCGGRGLQDRNESYTEYSGGQSVTRTRTFTVTCANCSGSGKVTCTTCTGCGRVVQHQTLTTQWQRLIPATTAPRVEVTELIEDAEERCYLRVPLVEDRRQLVPLPQSDGIEPELAEELAAAVPALAADLPHFAQAVESLQGGMLYRADFQVTGLWAMRIEYQRLPGEVGWFFGRRPEFHFPSLPLSWSAVGTALFVVPFLAMTFLAIVSRVQVWLTQSLPSMW